VRIDLAETGRTVKPSQAGSLIGTRLLILAEDAALLARGSLAAAIAARSAGYDVHVAASGTSHEAEAVLETIGLTLHKAPITRAKTPLLEKLRSMAALDRLVRALKPDLLHCLGLKAVLYGGTLARLRRLSAVLSVPGIGSLGVGAGLLRARMMGFALGGPKATIVVKTPEDRLGLVRAGLLDSRRPTFLLRGAAVDLARFAPARGGRGAQAVGAAPLVLVSADGLDDVGLCRLSRARQILCNRGIAARFVLAPGGPPMPGLDEAEGTMPEALARADVLCLPGDPGETVPQSLIEAAAAARVMVAPDLRGCREVVRPGVTGWLFAPGDAAGLALALERVLLDVGFRKAAGERARELAVAEFSQDAFLTAALTVYRAGLAGAFVPKSL
jgi:hypothetical protein